MSNKEKLKPSFNQESLAGHLRRHFDGDIEATLQAIEEYISEHPEAKKAEVFTALSSGKGNPDTHASGKKEGGLKKGVSIFRSRKNH